MLSTETSTNRAIWGAGRLQVDGLPLYFKRAGRSGPTVLFLHGWGDSHVVWEPIMARLAPHCLCLALDLPGFGESGVPMREYQVQELATLVGRFLDALAIERAVVVGHSLGGMLTLRLALDRPALVSRLVLVAAAYVGHLPPALQIMLTMLGRPVLEGARVVRAAAGWALHPVEERLPLSLRESGRRSRAFAQAPAWVLQRTLHAIARIDLRPEIGRISQPALIINGEQDRVIPHQRAEWLALRLPNARLVTLPGIGHHPMADDLPTFSRLLTPFVVHGAFPSLPAAARPTPPPLDEPRST